MIYGIIGIQVLLCLVDGFPLKLSLLSIFSHVVYLGNMRKFPVVKLSDPLFIASCGMHDLPSTPELHKANTFQSWYSSTITCGSTTSPSPPSPELPPPATTPQSFPPSPRSPPTSVSASGWCHSPSSFPFQRATMYYRRWAARRQEEQLHKRGKG